MNTPATANPVQTPSLRGTKQSASPQAEKQAPHAHSPKEEKIVATTKKAIKNVYEKGDDTFDAAMKKKFKTADDVVKEYGDGKKTYEQILVEKKRDDSMMAEWLEKNIKPLEKKPSTAPETTPAAPVETPHAASPEKPTTIEKKIDKLEPVGTHDRASGRSSSGFFRTLGRGITRPFRKSRQAAKRTTKTAVRSSRSLVQTAAKTARSPIGLTTHLIAYKPAEGWKKWSEDYKKYRSRIGKK